jgi:predicted O-linked N-acetylglucosamine transferase (SPINDLY family)
MTVALASQTTGDLIAGGRAALAAGDPVDAANQFYSAAQANPIDYESRYWLYSALVAAGEAEAARQFLIDARALHAVAEIRSAGADMARFQRDPAYCAEVGARLYAAGHMGKATIALGRSLDFDNLDPSRMLQYGLSLQHQGRLDEAIEVFTAATETFNRADVHEFLLYALFHAPDRMARVSAEARRWSDLHATPSTPPQARFGNARDAERRLRVGYVGPNITRSQLAQFLLPVLEAHDREAVEVFIYCADPAQETGLPEGCVVRATAGVRDADLADMIRKDEIDILVDVWGHTAGSRLPMFGHKPAPVQVAWINFVQTTGMPAIDYVLHADSMKVEGTDAYFTETIWHIGPIVAPSRPPADRPEPVPTPALKNGYVTYGSFNNPAKLSEPTVAAWARILSARPADRLVLKYRFFVDPILRRATQARFAAYGVDAGQLEFRGHTTGQDYLREFQDIDLALDTSPCPGGTTSCDALANGVPVLTQWGDDFYARIGVPVVAPCGLSECIADGWDDYVEKALALTADARALDALRSRVRPGFDASPYCDDVGFTRNLEQVFRRMFERWLEQSA